MAVLAVLQEGHARVDLVKLAFLNLLHYLAADMRVAESRDFLAGEKAALHTAERRFVATGYIDQAKREGDYQAGDAAFLVSDLPPVDVGREIQTGFQSRDHHRDADGALRARNLQQAFDPVAHHAALAGDIGAFVARSADDMEAC